MTQRNIAATDYLRQSIKIRNANQMSTAIRPLLAQGIACHDSVWIIM